MPGLILEAGVDNSKVGAGLQQFEAMVDARVRAIQSKLNRVGATSTRGNFGAFGGGVVNRELSQIEGRFNKATAVANRFGGSLDRIAGVLNGGLGLGVAVGGLAAMEKAFTRAITKAKQFEVAQLAISAAIQSSYKITGSKGQELTGLTGFQAAQTQARKINKEIIKRQAVNILTYEEQLGAYQSSINAGARKGLNLKQVMDVSENISIAAKTLGLRGEQIANASRLALGGGVNVGRSTIGRALGISNEDISKRSGDDLVNFLMEKTKGFSAGQQSFAQSIEGIISTLEARLDVFFAKVGQRLMKKLAPAIESLGSVLEGGGADQFADVLVQLFTSVFKALEMIAQSPAIPMLMKFLNFIASYGDKLLIVGALTKFAGIMTGLAGSVRGFTSELVAMSEKAMLAAGSLQETTVAAVSLNEATGVGGGRSRGMPTGGIAGMNTAPAGSAAAVLADPFSAKERIKAYNQAKKNVGPARANLSGTTMEAYYIEKEHKEKIRTEMRNIQNKGLSANTRLRGDKAFAAFEESMGFTPSATNERQTIARLQQYEERVMAARVAKRRALMAKLGYIGANNLQNAVSFGTLGFLGGQGVGALTDNRGGATEAVGNAAEQFLPMAGATLGLTNGLKTGQLLGRGGLRGLRNAGIRVPAGMSVAAPLIALEAGLSTGNAIQGATIGADEAAQAKSEGDLEKTYDENPILKQIAQLKSQMARLRQNTNLKPEYRKARLEEMNDQLQNLRETGRASFVSDTAQKDIEGEIQKRQKSVAGYQLGYGNTRSVLSEQSKLTEAQIRQAAMKGELGIDDDVKAKAEVAFNRAQRGREIFRQIAPQGIMDERMLKYQDLEEAQQDIQANKLIAQNKMRLSDQRRIRALDQVSFQAGLNPNQIEGGLSQGLAGVEASLRGNREKFDMGPEQFEELIKTAKAKFVQDFNAPLRKVEAQIQALGLGGAPETFGRMVDLTVSASEKKLDELGRQFGLSTKEVEALKVQARNRGQVEKNVNLLTQAATIFGARGNPMAAARFQKQAELENDRLKLDPSTLKQMGFANFEAYRKVALEQFDKQQRLERVQGGGKNIDRQLKDAIEARQREFRDIGDEQRFSQAGRGIDLRQRELDNAAFDASGRRMDTERNRFFEDAPLNLADAKLGARSAEISAQRAQLAPRLDVGGPFSDAAAAIRYKIDSQKGFNAGDYEAAYKQSKQLDQEEAEMAKQTTEIAKQRAGLNLARTEADYQTALEALTAQIAQRGIDVDKRGLDQSQADLNFGKSQEELERKKKETQEALAAGGVIPGGKPGSPFAGVQLAPIPANIAVPVAAKAGSGATGALDFDLNLTVQESGVDGKELAGYLEKEVPKLIEAYCRNKERKPR